MTRIMLLVVFITFYLVQLSMGRHCWRGTNAYSISACDRCCDGPCKCFPRCYDGRGRTCCRDEYYICGSLSWWAWLLISLGILLVIGVAIFFVVWCLCCRVPTVQLAPPQPQPVVPIGYQPQPYPYGQPHYPVY